MLLLQSLQTGFLARFGVILAALLVLFPGTAFAQQQERIKNFQTEIEIQPDGTLQVVDTITVHSEQRQIKRGIYRDFNTFTDTADGKRAAVKYDFQDITRDGVSEPFHIEWYSGAIRLFLGEENTFLRRGEYTYKNRYTVDRQIQFFDGHDVLIWNVTGNFWEFPIEQASAVLVLPPNGTFQSVKFFTGRFGEGASNGTQAIAADGGSVNVRRDQVLVPGEGLTIQAFIEKGVISSPTQAQRFSWFLRDHFTEIGALVIWLLISFYYLAVWLRVGRDLPGGVVVPNWTPPDDISPALANYIENRGFRGDVFRALSAALVNLAVKGLVTITGFDGTPTITRTEKNIDDVSLNALASGEKALLKRLGLRDALQISSDNGKTLKSIVTAFQNAIEREHGEVFFRLNRGYTVFGIGASVVGLVLLLVASNGELGASIPIIAVLAFGVFLITQLFLRLAKARRVAGRSRWKLLISVVPLLIFCVILFGVARFIIEMFGVEARIDLIGIVGIIATNYLFFKLLQAPTPLGRQIMDQIKGLSVYLKLAEQDRLNLKGAPSMTPQHFETLLPYAIALQLEEPWSDTFDNWLAAATAEQRSTASSGIWHGSSGNNGSRLGRDFSQMSRSLENGMRSSMPAPATSSGSGGGGMSSGGFSGGGGGSSGGGGW